jgi:hypothetical protein
LLEQSISLFYYCVLFLNFLFFLIHDSSCIFTDLRFLALFCLKTPLKNMFPVLFTIACAKEARVEENMAIVNGAIHWNVMFIRHVHDWELEEVLRFFELLYSQQIMHGGVDKICWIKY